MQQQLELLMYQYCVKFHNNASASCAHLPYYMYIDKLDLILLSCNML